MIKTIYFSSEDSGEKVISNIEFFSLMQDLRLAKLPLRQKLRSILLEYSKYVKMKKNTLDQETIKEIDQLLIQKFNTLINQCEDQIRTGQFLSRLLGITDQEFKRVADDFSRVYKRLLIARDSLGYIPRNNQANSDDAYKKLIAVLRKQVFEPVLSMFSYDPAALPEGLPAGSEDARVLTNGNPTLSQLYDNIVGIMRKENIEATISIEDDYIKIVPVPDRTVEIL
jgi:isoleucyl-tRNA synthetase